jgi:5-formyltetrahydrofolate cyclo-ligase
MSDQPEQVLCDAQVEALIQSSPQPTRKQELRRRLRQRRLEAMQGDAALGARILAEVIGAIETQPFPAHHPRKAIGIYWPLPGEVDLRELRHRNAHPLALPAADGEGRLTYHLWEESPLAQDRCGIPTPQDQPALAPQQLGLLLVPALAVDPRGIRLGYGGGYFDRLRAQPAWRSVPALVVLPRACLATSPLPTDPWDVPFDGWICETGCSRLTAC